MKIGVLTVLMSNEPLEKVLDFLQENGVEAVELGTGNYPGNAHCNPAELLDNDKKRNDLLKSIEKRGMVISALSCHGNPLHPNKQIALEHHETHRKTVLLAEKMGLDTVINFSGCPGDSPSAKKPNWVTCPWPPDYGEILEWQWKRKVIPYWKQESKFAKEHNIRIAFEMHPGFVVYNTETLLRLRKACGDNLGANFDPSHLWWQGMDPVVSIRALKDCIYHFHGKDCKVDPQNARVNGVLDTKGYLDEINRSWVFRTIGYGHDLSVWKDIVSELRLIGYDHVISIEHEDSLMSPREGLTKAVQLLKQAVIQEQPGAAWWT
ncbi:MAG: sugar phosphate isomerase/epimerase [Armatimonadetes bacterium]|nr:sugar phosphate isomerase/epimerase [Armatimonadota bacterium]